MMSSFRTRRRMIGLQFYDETAALLGVADDGAVSFGRYLGAIAAARGENVRVDADGASCVVTQTGWRLMAGVTPAGDVAFRAWNALWEGALAVHNRDLALSARYDDAGISWRISSV